MFYQPDGAVSVPRETHGVKDKAAWGNAPFPLWKGRDLSKVMLYFITILNGRAH